MNEIVNETLKYLDNKYNPSLVLIYGSFCTNTLNDESDIDLLIFANINSSTHDSSNVLGHDLDAWIYPENEISNIENYLHIIPCEIIKDENEVGLRLIEKIMKLRNKVTCPLSKEESEQLSSWINKMIDRSKGDSIESNYRYTWLLNDLPELYCKFKEEYYNGPIKALNLIKNNNRDIYETYKQLLCGKKNVTELEGMYRKIT